MKLKPFVLLLILFQFSCGGGGDDSDGGGNIDPPPQPKIAGNAILTSPENSTSCVSGTTTTSGKSNVEFNWQASVNTSTYEIQITNLNTNGVTTKTNLTSTTVLVELENAKPYSWKIISANDESSQKGTSLSWKFYLAGEGIKNYSPFPAELQKPVSGSTVARNNDGSVNFEWAGADPDGDELKYTLYIDKDDGKQTPSSDNTDLTDQTKNIQLDEKTIYYWRIKTSDGENSSYSLVYSFRTE